MENKLDLLTKYMVSIDSKEGDTKVLVKKAISLAKDILVKNDDIDKNAVRDLILNSPIRVACLNNNGTIIGVKYNSTVVQFLAIK